MLQYILGRAGSGKTEQIIRALEQDVQRERTVLLLVPEQFSYESERILLARLGVKNAAKVQILSFTRLADRVLRDIGGIAVRRLDEVTRALLMSRALELYAAPEHTQDVSYSKSKTYDPAYLSSLLALSAECKQCGITPRLLGAAAQSLPDSALKNKLQELQHIFDIYDGLTQGSGIDPEDLLRILSEKLPTCRLFDGAHVYVDGFKGFTAVELQVLEQLMTVADVTITLCTDNPRPTDNSYGLFAPSEHSMRQLSRIAAERGVTIATPCVLTENHRAKHPALLALEKYAFSPRVHTFDENADAITVTACPDVYTECTAVSRTIRRALQSDPDLRAKDIAIVVRNLSDYRGILDTALRRAEIPFYTDEAANVYTQPLISLCLSALRIACGGWQSDEILRIMKTGLLPFDEIDTATLENYVFMWRIDGKQWESPFAANPSGLTESRAFDREMLQLLESLRRRVTAPLSILKNALADRVDGKTYATALYAYLTNPAVTADKGVKTLYESFITENEPHLAEQTARLWDSVMSLLDHFATVFDKQALTARRYTDLFHLAAGLITLPSVPQSLDAVQIGSADHVRLQAPKLVCLLGVNEGVFPAYPSEGNLLSDRERETLEESGVSLSGNRLLKAAEERFFLYTAMTAPSEQLYLSFVTSKGGDVAVPAAPLERIMKQFPRVTKDDCRINDPADIRSVAEALDRLAEDYHKQTPEVAALREVLKNLPHTAHILQCMEKGANGTDFSLQEASAHDLFGEHMAISASQADAFHLCRFKYFCQYGMGLNTRKIADVDNAVFGTFSHYVLETLLPTYIREGGGTAPADIPVMQQRIRAVLHEYIETQMGGFDDKPARFRYLLSLVERTCFSLLWFAVNEMAQSRFTPADYELSIGDKNGIPSPVLNLDGGGTISIIGKIDRVDIYKRADTVFVRVVDYKTGSKEFKLGEVPYGINMQMLLYLFAVCQNADKRYTADHAAPAGILYLPAKDITQKNAESPMDERLKLLRMNGLLLRDADVLTAMEAQGAGVFIPATVSGNEIGKKSAAASREDFDNIRGLTERLLVQMANTLLAGDIAAVPTGETEKLPCRYCDYHAVCGRTEGDPIRLMRTANLENTLKALQEEVQADG